MGVNTVYPVGTILTRKEKKNNEHDVLRVVGSGGKLVVTPHEEYGVNVQITAAEVQNNYEVSYPEGVEEPRVPPVAANALSPEQVFAEAAAKAEAPKKGRPKKANDANN